MLYDTLNHLEQYATVHPGVIRGLRFLAQADFDSMADGRYEIDGDNVFANVMTFQTKADNPTPETHATYIDIQYLISGSELMGVIPVEETTGIAEARPEGDIWLHHAPAMDYVRMGGGRFIAVWPGDAHAPGIAPGGVCGPARKCVVKVRVDM